MRPSEIEITLRSLFASILAVVCGYAALRLEKNEISDTTHLKGRFSLQLDFVVVMGLLFASIVMFAIGKPRMDAVALLMLAALPFTGVLSFTEALAGFGDANVVLIALLFVLGHGLVRTGVARAVGDWLARKAGASDVRLISMLMSVVCALGSTMSSTAVTAIFIPVTLRISQSTGRTPGQLMMPLSIAALVSGMMTLVATSPNLVVNAELIRRGEAGFQFFSFTPFGIPIIVVAIAYMLIARRWLPHGSTNLSNATQPLPSLQSWVTHYGLAERELRVRVLPGSLLIGIALNAKEWRSKVDAQVIAIERKGKLIQPTPTTELECDDVLLLDCRASKKLPYRMADDYRVEVMPLTGGYFTDVDQEIGMFEVIVPPDSALVAMTVKQAKLRSQFGLTLIGLRRGKTALEGELTQELIRVGDTLLLIGPWAAIKNSQLQNLHFVALNLPQEFVDLLPAAGKHWQACVCLLLTIGLMVSGLIPNVQAALIGCLMMGVLGCITLESAYRSIDWKILVLIVGMLPFSIALQRTGGVDMAAEALMAATSGMGTRAVLACLFAITVMLGMFVSNTATAVLMAPVALSIAENLSLSPYPFAMIVALASSTAFITPVSSPVNTLIVTPGGYAFKDFVYVGLPLSILVMIVCVVLVPIVLVP